MLLILYFSIIIINIIAILRKRQGKWIVLVDILLSWIIISGYYEGIDIITYRYSYAGLQNSGISNYMNRSYGYYLSEKLACNMGLDFFEFKRLMTGISLILLHKGIRAQTDNTIFVWCSYLIYQIIFDTIQFRNFVGFSIFIFSVQFLKKEGKKNLIKYIFFILIGSSFHEIIILFLIFIIIKNKKILNLWGIISLFFVLLTVINSFRIPLSRIALEYINDLSLNLYFSRGGATSIAFLLPLLSNLGYTILFWYTSNIKSDTKSSNFSRNINLVDFIYIPFCLISFQWYRIIRNTNMIYYCGIGDVLRKEDKNAHLEIFLFSFLIILFWVYCDCVRFAGIESVKTVFKYNIYFNKDDFFEI